MNNFPLDTIRDYLISKFPEEGCGLVINLEGVPTFIPCVNSHDSPLTDFYIKPIDFADAEDLGEVLSIVHSHPKGVDKAPSSTDVAAQKMNNIPWLIFDFTSSITGEIVYLNEDKAPVPELYRRKYIWQFQDCYTFVRDWYELERGIILPDFYRKKNFWEYGEEIYLDNFNIAGFEEITLQEATEGDVILMSLAKGITTHAAIYLGDNLIGHHLPGRLSCKDIYGLEYREKTTKVVRYVKNN